MRRRTGRSTVLTRIREVGGVPGADAVDVGTGPELLRAAVAEAARESGASVTAVYLLPADEPVLRPAVLGGASYDISRPWARVAHSAAYRASRYRPAS